jgi:hypothetical protein
MPQARVTGSHISIGGVVIATAVATQADPEQEEQPRRGAAIGYAYSDPGAESSSQQGSDSESLEEELQDYLANVQVGARRWQGAGGRAGQGGRSGGHSSSTLPMAIRNQVALQPAAVHGLPWHPTRGGGTHPAASRELALPPPPQGAASEDGEDGEEGRGSPGQAQRSAAALARFACLQVGELGDAQVDAMMGGCGARLGAAQGVPLQGPPGQRAL